MDETVSERIAKAMEQGWTERLAWSRKEAGQMVIVGVESLVRSAQDRVVGFLYVDILAGVDLLELLRSSEYAGRFFDLLLEVVPVDLYVSTIRIGYYRLGNETRLVEVRGKRGQHSNAYRGRLEYSFPVITSCDTRVQLNFPYDSPSTPVQQAFAHISDGIQAGPVQSSRVREVLTQVVQLTRLHAVQVCALGDPVRFYMLIFQGCDPVPSYFEGLPTK